MHNLQGLPLFDDGTLTHGILINAGSESYTIGTMTLESGVIMFPSHNVVAIDSYGVIQDNQDARIELTGTFGDDLLIAGSGDRVRYEMEWSPGTDTLIGDVDQWGRSNGEINFETVSA